MRRRSWALDPAAPPERLAPGCWRVALPDPFVPHVTAVFLLEGPDGDWLLDTGADTAESESALRAKLAGLGRTPEELAGAILSHTHLDHAGGLLRWRPRTLWAHARAAEEMREVHPRSSRGPAALAVMGVPTEQVGRLAPHGEPVGENRLRTAVEVTRELRGDGGALPPPGWEWLRAEGHAPGHLVLHHRESGTLLSGDQFLARWKTPYRVSDPDEDAFGEYLDSIERCLARGVEEIHSCHTRTIADGATWLTERREALRAQRERVADAVAAGARTAWEALHAALATVPEGGLRVVLLREQLAILRHLAVRGTACRTVEEGVERFEPI